MLADLPPLQLNVHTDSPPVGSDTDDGSCSPRLEGWSGRASAAPLKPWPGATGDAVAGQFAFPHSPHDSGSACSTPSFSESGETPRPRATPAAVSSDCCDSATGGDDDSTATAAAAAAAAGLTPRGWTGDGLATIEEAGGKDAARRYRHCLTAPPHLHLELPHPRGCFARGDDSPSGCVVGSWGDAAAGHGPPVRGFCPSAGGVHRALLRAREVRRSSSDCAPRYQAAAQATVAATASATPTTAAVAVAAVPQPHHHHHHSSHRAEQPQQSPHFPWPCGARTPLTSPKGGACAAAAAAADALTPRRFSISRAKAVLAECAVGVADRGAFVACETGVLSPLLARIRNDGAPPSSPPDGNSGGSGGHADTDGSSADGAPSPLARRSVDLFPPSSRCPVEAAAAAAAVSPTSDGVAQRQRHLIDCLDTVNYLSVDAANRSALLNMHAAKLIASKLCAATAAALGPAAGVGEPPRTAAAAPTSPAVGAASLRALSGLLRSDSAKADFLGGPGGDALLALLGGSGRRSELQEGAFAAAEALCWSSAGCGSSSAPTSPSAASYLASSLYGSSAGGFAATGHGAGAAAPRLLEPRLIGALASGRALHPRTDPTVTSAALRLLSLALRSLPQASPPPSPQAVAGAGVDPQRAALRPWRSVAFALVPLLVDAALPQQPTACRDARRAVVTAALGLAASMADTQELASALCAAGALPPTLALLSSDCGSGGGGSSASSSIGSSAGNDAAAGSGPSIAARAAVAVAAMARRGGRLALTRLREEGALAVLLSAVSDSAAAPAARVSLLCALGRAVGDESDGSASRAAAAACLHGRGAVSVLQCLVTDAEASGHREESRRVQEVLLLLNRALAAARAEDGGDAAPPTPQTAAK